MLIDPAKRSVLNIGYGSKIETEQFSETVIAAVDKDLSGQPKPPY